MTNLFVIAGHFVSYRWVSGPHNFLFILWNLLKTKKIVHQQKQTTNESNNCWSRLNASWAARNPFVGRMFVTPGLTKCVVSYKSCQVWSNLIMASSTWVQVIDIVIPKLCWALEWITFVGKRMHSQKYNVVVELLPRNQLKLSYRLGLTFLKNCCLALAYKLQVWCSPTYTECISLLFISKWAKSCRLQPNYYAIPNSYFLHRSSNVCYNII